MTDRKQVQFGVKYTLQNINQVQIELSNTLTKKEVFESLKDTGIEFLIYSTSSVDCELSAIFPDGIAVSLVDENDDTKTNSFTDSYTSLLLSRRPGTRICIRLDESATYEEFARFEEKPIVLQHAEEGKFRLSSEQIWQFNRGEEYRQTIMTTPNSIPDSIKALMGVIDCDDPLDSQDIKRLNGQANYAKFRIEEYMKVAMSSQTRDTLHSYIHTLGLFIGNLKQANLRARRIPVLEDLRKDFLIEELTRMISKTDMSILKQNATAAAMKKMQELYPDHANKAEVISADTIEKKLTAWPFHEAISKIFTSNTSTTLPINPCSKCKSQAQIKPIKNNNKTGTRWMVQCMECDNALNRNHWQSRGHGAVAIWNKTNPCDSTTLDNVPFLELANLTRKEAKAKILEVSKYMDVKNEHIKAIESESTPSQRVWLNKQKSQLAYLSNVLTHARAVLSHQNLLSSGNDLE